MKLQTVLDFLYSEEQNVQISSFGTVAGSLNWATNATDFKKQRILIPWIKERIGL
jgi:hypothetical protein